MEDSIFQMSASDMLVCLTTGFALAFFLIMGVYFFSSKILFRKVGGVTMLVWAAQYLEQILLALPPMRDYLTKEFYLFYLLSLLIIVPVFVMLLYALLNVRHVNLRLFVTHALPFLAMDVLYLLVMVICPSWCQIAFDGFMGLATLYMAGMAFYLVRYYRLYHKRLEQYYAEYEGQSVRWVLGVIVSFVMMAVIFVCFSMSTSGYVGVAYNIFTMGVWLYIMHHLAVKKPAEFGYIAEEKAAEPAEEESLRFSFVPDLERVCAEGVLLQPHLTVEELARRAGTNRSYLSLYLNSVKGKSFFDYVNDYRMEEATRMLRETESTVDDVAIRCGYSGAVSMRRIFQRHYGCTPSEWRSKNAVRTDDE